MYNQTIRLLYRRSLKASQQIPNYNFSQFIQRKLKHEYRIKIDQQQTQEVIVQQATDVLNQIIRIQRMNHLYWQPGEYESILKKQE